MLTIENIEKIKQYSYDVQWTCDKIGIDEDKYIFFVDRRNISGQVIDYCRIDLSRIPEADISNYKDGKVYAISLNMEKTKHIVTADYISKLNNLVNTFTQILGDYVRK